MLIVQPVIGDKDVAAAQLTSMLSLFNCIVAVYGVQGGVKFVIVPPDPTSETSDKPFSVKTYTVANTAAPYVRLNGVATSSDIGIKHEPLYITLESYPSQYFVVSHVPLALYIRIQNLKIGTDKN